MVTHIYHHQSHCHHNAAQTHFLAVFLCFRNSNMVISQSPDFSDSGSRIKDNQRLGKYVFNISKMRSLILDPM